MGHFFWLICCPFLFYGVSLTCPLLLTLACMLFQLSHHMWIQRHLINHIWLITFDYILHLLVLLCDFQMQTVQQNTCPGASAWSQTEIRRQKLVYELQSFDNTGTLSAIWYCFKYKAYLKVSYITLILKEKTARYEGSRQSSINNAILNA